MSTDARELLRALAEPDRMRVVAALVLGARMPRDVAAATGLTERDVLRALARLEAAELVTHGETGWQWNDERVKEAAREAAPAPASDDFGTTDPDVTSVLRVFVRDGRLTSIPVHRGKRLVVLDHVARVFDPGVRYSEREVNAMLAAFHDDVAALRRYLVDEQFLSRESGEYWRTGGHVDV